MSPKSAIASPIEFQWGTFCKQVLSEHDTQEQSLIGVTSALAIGIKTGRDQKVLDCQLPSISVHASFKRREFQQPVLQVPVEFEFEFPGYEKEATGKGSASLMFAPEHEFGQFSVKINNPRVKVPTEPGIYKVKLKVSFSVAGEVIGKVELPVQVEVIGL